MFLICYCFDLYFDYSLFVHQISVIYCNLVNNNRIKIFKSIIKILILTGFPSFVSKNNGTAASFYRYLKLLIMFRYKY